MESFQRKWKDPSHENGAVQLNQYTIAYRSVHKIVGVFFELFYHGSLVTEHNKLITLPKSQNIGFNYAVMLYGFFNLK